MKKLKSNRLSRLSYGQDFPTPAQKRAREELERAQDIGILMSQVSTPEARNRINTAEDAQYLIDKFEELFPHEDLPPEYDWLISRRDRLSK